MKTTLRAFSSTQVFVAAIVAALVLGLSIQDRLTAQLTLATLLDHGPVALAVLLAAFGLGTLLTPLFQLHHLPLRWKVMLSAGLGLGGLSTLYLILGTLGWLNRALHFVVIGVLMAWGVGWLVHQITKPGHSAAPLDIHHRGRWWWLAGTPFIVLMLWVAVTPPGVLWAEEGYGYDELEYHLQVPREYYDRDQITYLPHNVYANFPSNVELLGMSCMILAGDAHDGAMSGKLVNGALAGLAIAALWLIGREKSEAIGRTTALLGLSTGWIVYLSGVFFVENGLLLFATLATACLLRAGQAAEESSREDSIRSPWRWIILAGLFCGFACGCKYTAIPLVVLPLAVGLLVVRVKTIEANDGAARRATWKVAARSFGFLELMRRFSFVAAFLTATVIAFSPWLIKNTAMTGNPLFPLFNSVFQGAPPDWGVDETLHWDASHRPSVDELTLAGKSLAWWHRIPGDPKQRMGLITGVLAVLAIMMKWRERLVLFCGIVLVVQTLLWATTTHLYARMAVPMIIPIVILAGIQIHAPSTLRFGRFAPGILLLSTLAVNLVFMTREYVDHLYRGHEKLPVEGYYGHFTEGKWPGYEHLAVINRELPKDAKLLVLGDAKAFYYQRPVDYCVVFNRNPFVEAIRTATADVDIIDWLTDRGYTHVFIHWAEVERLRRSAYGFPEEINASLFETLVSFRLKRTHVFSVQFGEEKIPYAELYELPG